MSMLIKQPVADLADRHKCIRTALNELLSILRKQRDRLPKDSCTLLKIPRSINIIQNSGGDYLYLGIEWNLKGYCRASIAF
jgi:hypothetical protein